MMNEFFMNLEGPVFRPPREHDALIVQAVTGCSRNSCLFCAMYKAKKFRAKKPAEIEAEMARIPAPFRGGVSKIFLADGNAFCLGSSDLLEMAAIFKKYFVNNRFISVYANPLDITAKSPEELKALRAAGYKNLYIGLESGSDSVLQTMKKAGSFKDSERAMNLAHEAGFVLSVTILLGIGGKKYSGEHAAESARLIDACAPRFVSTLTTTLYEGAPLYNMVKTGEFEMPENCDIIEEHYNFIEAINADRIIYRSNHVSNFIGLEGVLSRDKNNLLRTLSRFKEVNSGNNFIKLKTGGNYEI